MQNQETGELEPINSTTELEQAIKNSIPVFRVGEEILLKGGRFRIKSFGKKFMMLEGLPGTKCFKTGESKFNEDGEKLFSPPVEVKKGGRLK